MMTESYAPLISLQQWQQWLAEPSQRCTQLPFVAAFSLTPEEATPSSWQPAWQQASPHAAVLESGKEGTFTYLTLKPTEIFSLKNDSKSLHKLRAWMSEHRTPPVEGLPIKFIGGAIGFISYDVARSIERLPAVAEDDLGMPDLHFMRCDEVWVIDVRSCMLYCTTHVDRRERSADELAAAYADAAMRTAAMAALWRELTADPAARAARAAREAWAAAQPSAIDIEQMAGLTSRFPKQDFVCAVDTIRAYIAQGDVFQVNLSQRLSLHAPRVDADDLYEWIRILNPSPYMGFYKTPEFQLVCGSPELLIERCGDQLFTRPIAGTRRRGRTPEEDAVMEHELRTTIKERAEHIMLVDLERNDLGRVSAFGSVHVPELMVIERYSHVMHLVSQVNGTLAAGKDSFDVLAATFPGGTITGAPKIRTMEVIEELEPTRRNVYTGSLGWIDYNGNMEFNIIIRTMLIKDEHIHVQAGAGIVIDSIPEREYSESLNKAKALWRAVQMQAEYNVQEDMNYNDTRHR